MTTFLTHWRTNLGALAMLAMATDSHAGTDLMTREICKVAVPQVAKAFAGVLEPIRREGHCLAGDFTGDGRPDVLMVVKILVGKVPAATGIKTTYPFRNKESGKGRLRFLAMHSTPGNELADWTRNEKFLLDGGSPIMVLHSEDMESDMERVARRAKAVRDLGVPPRAIRGDAVSLYTHAVPAIVYWNGTSYVLHEDPSGP